MLFLPTMMLAMGGLIPLLLAKGFLKSKNSIYVLGWLAWVAGVALKSFIGLFITLFFPWIFLQNTLVYVVYAVIVETTEVIAAFIFIKYHPDLKKINLHDIIAFGAGFGIGEALTLAFVFLLPIDVVFQGLVSTMAMFERMFAVIIHLVSAVFIGLYVKERRRSDLAGGILSKDLSALFVIIPTLLLTYGLSSDNATYMTEILIGIYSLIWALVLFIRIRGKKLPEPGKGVDMSIRNIVISFVVFLFTYIIYNYINITFFPGESFASIILGFFTSMILVSMAFYHTWRKSLRRTEVMIGGFLGAGVFQFYQNYLGALSDPNLYLLAGLNVMSGYMYSFMGIMMGLWFYEIISKKQIKLPRR